ncbi:hypothetical protein CYMTET_49824 [Cymbomonas tetramitiformis]|uniref:Uncharacterized protein n=1 Tax=Cymbomonas tetramitiformis TaxID=36881 RepID=A0AAE0BR47_9CHLO|nr:hypothetical protein CYMTET_49824 [Cymbomonas tetramitiformis]
MIRGFPVLRLVFLVVILSFTRTLKASTAEQRKEKTALREAAKNSRDRKQFVAATLEGSTYAVDRCTKFVIFTREGAGSDQLIDALNLHPDISVVGEAFGVERSYVMKGLGIQEAELNDMTLDLWANEVWRYAAAMKGFGAVLPIRCAIGFKLVDYNMGGMETTRMFAEDLRIQKIVYEQTNVTHEWEIVQQSIAAHELQVYSAYEQGVTALTAQLAHDSKDPNALANLTLEQQESAQTQMMAMQAAKDLKVQLRGLKSAPGAPASARALPADEVQRGGDRRLLRASRPRDVLNLKFRQWPKLLEKQRVPKCRVQACDLSEFLFLHRNWYQYVKEKMVAAGSTWLEVEGRDLNMAAPCQYHQTIGRATLYLQQDVSSSKDECLLMDAVTETCTIWASNCSVSIVEGQNAGARIVGHDVPRWAHNWG